MSVKVRDKVSDKVVYKVGNKVGNKVGFENVYVLIQTSVNLDMYYMRLIREIVGVMRVLWEYMYYICCVM